MAVDALIGDCFTVTELFKGKKGILIAVPGAFTPGCSQVGKNQKLDCTSGSDRRVAFPLQKHLPSYVKKYDDITAKGVEVIACISVNDPFV